MSHIVIDPGHGGADSGAVGYLQGVAFFEKDIVLAVGKRVCYLLNSYGVSSSMTRESDKFMSLKSRAAIANHLKAILVSIHCNAGGGIGFECFTSPGKTKSDVLATIQLENWGEDFPTRKGRLDFSDGDPDKEARFTVLTKTKKEATLFEMGFMDTPADLEWLIHSLNQELMAQSIVRSIMQYLGVGIIPILSPSPPAELTLEQKVEKLWNIHLGK